VKTQLEPEITEYGEVVLDAFRAAGGLDLMRAHEGGDARYEQVEGILEGLGVWDLRPHEGGVDLQAAAEVCRAAGFFAAPYPVAERLSSSAGERTACVAVTTDDIRINFADAPLEWYAYDLAGKQGKVNSIGPSFGGKLASSVFPATVDDWSGRGDPNLVLLLQSWTLLGMVQNAAALTYRYVSERKQFDKAISAFQGVQFQLADMAVAIQSIEELCKYTLWSVEAHAADALVDVIALRSACLESADLVFRGAHQLHGAIGFCDETDVSWLSRYSQPYRRLPMGRSQTDDLLTTLCERSPLPGLFHFSSVADDALIGSR